MPGTKPTISLTISPPQKTVARHAEAFCSKPWENSRLWTSDDCYLDDKAGSVFVNPEWTPANFPWTKDDYTLIPSDTTAWVEAQDALGKGDYGVAYAGNATYPVTTSWIVLSTNDAAHRIKRNQGVVFSFTWHRPASETLPQLQFFPRVDTNTFQWVGSPAAPSYFSPFVLSIDSDLRLRVMEYPYDNYVPWWNNYNMALTEVYSHPLVIGAEELANKWHTIWVQPVSNDEIRVISDILRGDGFLYRSICPRLNIQMSPEGVAAVQAVSGGIGAVNICPLTMPATGTFKGPKQSKSKEDSTYPSLKVFGWSPTVINTNDGFLDNQVIDPDTGFGGITYKVYSVTTDGNGVETEALVPTSGGPDFKDFKVEVTLTPSQNVSQTINDVVVDFAEDTQTNTDPSVDVSADVVSISESASADFGSYKTKLQIRNQNGTYDSIATRPVNEINLDIAGVDRATLFTLNPGYDWLKTPRHGALTLEWECGDGFAYLQRELLAKHPPYDGLLLSDALTEFMARIGYTAERVDIDATPGVYLPKKRGRDNHLFKPEDGSSAADFLKQLHEWFQSEWTCRFAGDGKFLFKDASALTVARTYYPASSYKPDPDDYVIYGDAKVELMHDQFYNEIWVVGKDTRNNKPIVMVYQNLPSQTDKDAPDYVGRRLLMIVLTKANRADAVYWILYQLALHYGKIRTRVTFNTRVDPLIHEQDFIKIYGVAHLWRIENITNDVQVSNVASSNINTTTPVVRGSQITAIQWPTVV